MKNSCNISSKITSHLESDFILVLLSQVTADVLCNNKFSMPHKIQICDSRPSSSLTSSSLSSLSSSSLLLSSTPSSLKNHVQSHTRNHSFLSLRNTISLRSPFISLFLLFFVRSERRGRKRNYSGNSTALHLARIRRGFRCPLRCISREISSSNVLFFGTNIYLYRHVFFLIITLRPCAREGGAGEGVFSL